MMKSHVFVFTSRTGGANCASINIRLISSKEKLNNNSAAGSLNLAHQDEVCVVTLKADGPTRTTTPALLINYFSLTNGTTAEQVQNYQSFQYRFRGRGWVRGVSHRQMSFCCSGWSGL